MWESYQFTLLIIASSLVLVYNANSLPKFAMYSEFCWLSCYLLSSILASFIDTPTLFSAPFIILVLTAVEAVIIWTLVVYATNKE